MRQVIICSFALTALVATPVRAGDKPLFGAVPGWVTPAPPLDAGTLSHPGNVVPLFDEQVLVDGDTVTGYFDTARTVASAEMLTKMGTLTFDWKPDHGDLTLYRVDIIRNGTTIDALHGGAGITILQREAGLERLAVDGKLTAVKRIEGLQVGDVLRTAFSISERDTVLAGNVQDAMVLLPTPIHIGYGRARLVWPTARGLAWKALMPGIAETPRPLADGRSELVVTLPVAKLAEMPKNMPSRFEPLPAIEFSSFPGWDAVAKVMAPLYAVKGTIAPGSELAGRVDAIAARTPDPIERMAAALQMVQDDVRYQLVAMGTGNYVPQTPADTWAKRYGDCKAKTLLLLAVLDRLGISAEPVLANSKRGDSLTQRLPSAMAFDHVFVRARVKGEDFWLDGTLLGSRLADIRDAPYLGYVLPLFEKDAALVDLPRRAHARPDLDIDLAYDMTGGPHLPAPYHLVLRYAGPFGASLMVEQGADYDERLTGFAEKAAKNWTDSDTIGKPHADYDLAQAVWTLTIDGVAYPDWKFSEGAYGLAVPPSLKVDFDAPRGRSSWRAIPALITTPWTAHDRVTMHLPDAGKGGALTGDATAALALPAVDWRRSVTQAGGDVIEDTLSRESGVEVGAEAISATDKSISDAMARTAHIGLAASYPQRWDDVPHRVASSAVTKARALFDARIAEKPDDATRLADRGWFEKRLFDWAAAEADYSKAIAIDATAGRYLDRSQIRASRGDHAGALKDAQAAYDMEQGNKDVREQLADELAKAGRVDEALDLTTADADITTDAGLSSFLERVQVLEYGNRHADALAMLDGALAKRGNSAELHNARCWYKALRNADLDGALADCNRAIELSSDPAVYLDSRALVQFRAGRLQQARDDYEAALATSPEQASSLFMIGIVLARMGDHSKAAAEEHAARTVYPDIDNFYGLFGIKP